MPDPKHKMNFVEPASMPKEKPVSFIGRYLVHPTNVSWQFLKKKKRYITIGFFGAGYIAEMAGNIPLAGLLKLLGGGGTAVVAVEKVGEKLNAKTSGPKIDWMELIKMLIETLFGKKNEGKDNEKS